MDIGWPADPDPPDNGDSSCNTDSFTWNLSGLHFHELSGWSGCLVRMVSGMTSRDHYLVTGGSSGIGLSLVRRLKESGAGVTSIARRICPVEGVESLQWDLADSRVLERELAALPDHPAFDGLVICHGKGDFGSLEQFSAGRIRNMVELHLVSTLLICRHFLPGMKRRGRGTVIFLGSEAARKGAARGSVYCATKFGLRGIAQALREECSGSGVRVGLVNPGMVDTPFYDELDFSPGEDRCNFLDADDVANAIRLMLDMPDGSVIDEVNLSPLKKVIRRT